MSNRAAHAKEVTEVTASTEVTAPRLAGPQGRAALDQPGRVGSPGSRFLRKRPVSKALVSSNYLRFPAPRLPTCKCCEPGGMLGIRFFFF